MHRTLQMVLAYKHVTVFHGACPTGADSIADHFFKTARFPGSITVRAFPADWDTHGKKAGPLRNQVMVEEAVAMRSPMCRVVCMAYWNGVSTGTLDCLKRAVKLGIESAVIPPDRTKTFPTMSMGYAVTKPKGS